jgi:hypothetical protein
MVDESKIGLVIRRVKALVSEVKRRVDDHEKSGKGYSQGPTLRDFYAKFASLEEAVEEYEGESGHEHIPFVAQVVPGIGGDTDMHEIHESYGLFSFQRTHGPGAMHLFGSHVEYHPVTIQLEIRRAERRFSKDLSSDHIYGREHLLEVEMSAAQFTDAITLMNHGNGIPCTIRYVNGVQMEDVPSDHRSEQRMIVEGFHEKMKDVRASVDRELKVLKEILDKKSIGKEDRNKISWLFENVTRQFSNNAAFTMTKFNEATEKLKTEAKKEVEAYMQSILVGAGLEHLKAGASQTDALIESRCPALEAGGDLTNPAAEAENESDDKQTKDGDEAP